VVNSVPHGVVIDGTSLQVRHAPTQNAPPGGADVARVPIHPGGSTAESKDFANEMQGAMPLVVAAALSLCFLVLLLVFRSPFLALKAVFANLLSIGASFGLIVLVFQEGLGEDISGSPRRSPSMRQCCELHWSRR